MSSQKGNIKRTRPQKHQNNFGFKNDLHDKTVQNKMINKIEVSGVCSRCKEIIEWRIKYKKYKPLTVPKKCTKCEGKSVQMAYHVVCMACSVKFGICAKCSQSGDNIISPTPTIKEQVKQKSEFEMEIKFLPERQRRSLIRSVAKSDSENKTSKRLSTTDTSKDKSSDEIEDQIDELSLNSSSCDDEDI